MAPDFNYGLSTGEMKTLKDHREARIVLLVLFASSKSHDRLADLANASKRFHRSDVELLLLRELCIEPQRRLIVGPGPLKLAYGVKRLPPKTVKDCR